MRALGGLAFIAAIVAIFFASIIFGAFHADGLALVDGVSRGRARARAYWPIVAACGAAAAALAWVLWLFGG